MSTQMIPRAHSVTSSRFQRKIPGGRHDPLFKVVFGTTGEAARFFANLEVAARC
jgi:hypothetical protein